MLLAAISLSSTTNLLFSSSVTTTTLCAATTTISSSLKPLTNSSSSSVSATSATNKSSLNAPITLHYVSQSESENGEDAEGDMVSSASAVAAAIRRGSTSPVEFEQRREKDANSKLVLPSADFQRLCVEQLDLFRRIVDPEALLSVYVRPAGSYVMDRLELRRVTSYPGGEATDVVILVGTFNIPTGLRAAEAALSSQPVEFVAEHSAIVFPMVKHPFVVGFVVAEFPEIRLKLSSEGAYAEGRELIQYQPPDGAYGLPASPEMSSWSFQTVDEEALRVFNFTAEKILNGINISRSLAMAYVMDQKALLFQQSSWQNNVRMNNLVEQIRGPLSSIRTLSKMLSIHLKKSELSHDIAQDILVQADRMRDTLQELQDAVYVTKSNIIRFNEESLKKINGSTHTPSRSHSSDIVPRDSGNTLQDSGKQHTQNNTTRDLEMPMPPLALAPLKQNGIRPCSVSEVLSNLVEAVKPLACKQQRVVEFNELPQSLEVAVEEPPLRQALSNLIEGAFLRTHVGGKIEIVCTAAPAGGMLVVIDDDGPDMHYMTQMHSLTPFGAELLSENMVEDNMTWNFVAGLTVAREILESYGCVVRVISPRNSDAVLGAGGTRIELWLPPYTVLTEDLGSISNDA